MLFLNFFRKLPPPIYNYLKYKAFTKQSFYTQMWGGGIYADNLEKAISLNKTPDEILNKRYINWLKKDVILSYINLQITPEEYFVWDFEHKSQKEREEYLPNMTKDIILLRKIPQYMRDRLTDKPTLFSLMPDLFKRSVCVIQSEEDREQYMDFIKNNHRYFTKPTDGQCGRGAQILIGNNFDSLLSSGRWICEELIKQSKEMAVFNESSVNTVRLPTFLKNGKFSVLAPFFRTGRAGSIVDNGGAGGVIAAIDADTGLVITDGYDEKNQKYQFHPDSNIKFNGYIIPKWKELLETAEKAHRQLGDQRYIAWDFALTDEGWVLVEANSMGQFLWQYATKQGIKREFEDLMD